MRSRLVLPICGSAALLAASLLCAAAHADLSYTMSTKIDFPNMPPNAASFMPTISTVYYYTTDKERTDASVKSSFFNTSSVTISDCAANSVYTVDPDLNIYYVSDMSSAAPDPFGITSGFGGGFRPRPGGAAPKPTYNGTITANFKVTKVGDETINGVNAHHSKITITYTTTGTVPPTPTEPMTLDIWTDDTPRPVTCITKRVLSAGATGVPNISGVKYTYTGDVSALGDIMKGVPVRMQFAIPKMSGAGGPGGGPGGRFGAGGGTITMDRTDLSTDPLDPSTFAPPSGATKVSQEDFAKQQQAAMAQRFGGFGGGGGGGFGGPPPGNQ